MFPLRWSCWTAHPSLATTTTDAAGNYLFPLQKAARYQVRAVAPTFQSTTSEAVFVTSGQSRGEYHAGHADVNPAGYGNRDRNTYARGPGGRAGERADRGPVPLLDRGAGSDAPGSGCSSDPDRAGGWHNGLVIRGGNTNANKVLIDGVPADDIGGAVEFANIDTVGIEKIEVLREPNSALYGSDALAGVVSLTTARGSTLLPLLTYSGDGGNFNSFRQVGTLSGAFRQFDYYSAFARTRHAKQLSQQRLSQRDLCRQLWLDTEHGQRSALYGAPSYRLCESAECHPAVWHSRRRQREGAGQLLQCRLEQPDHRQMAQPDTLRRLALELSATPTMPLPESMTRTRTSTWALRSTYRARMDIASAARRSFNTARATAKPTPMTISPPASGTSSMPRPITGSTRISSPWARSSTKTSAARRLLPAERPPPSSAATTATRFSSQATSGTVSITHVGSGLEDNGLFGFAATPRASLAYYLFRPTNSGWLSGTKLNFSFGKGIKEPSIYYQSISLYDIFAALPNGAELIKQYHVSPIGPETSRTYDGGVDQQLWNGRARSA